MDTELSTFDIVLRVVFSLLFGFIIGLERETKRKPAGLRTNMLVALGSATFTILSLELFHSIFATRDRLSVDPLRIFNGVMEGLGFLGAGCIIQARGSVEGITTAATIWVVGGVGLACGAGYFQIATITTVFAFVVLTGLRWIEGRILPEHNK